MTLPDKNATFKPRTERLLLSGLVQDALREHAEAVKAGFDKDKIAELITCHAESKVDQEEMNVLLKYGCARIYSKVLVRIYDPKTNNWAKTTFVELTKPLLFPESGYGSSFSCGAPESYGERPEHHLPVEVESYFMALSEAQDLHKNEYHNVMDWPAKFKQATGKYPKWKDFAANFLVFGPYLTKKWENGNDAITSQE